MHCGSSLWLSDPIDMPRPGIIIHFVSKTVAMCPTWHMCPRGSQLEIGTPTPRRVFTLPASHHAPKVLAVALIHNHGPLMPHITQFPKLQHVDYYDQQLLVKSSSAQEDRVVQAAPAEVPMAVAGSIRITMHPVVRQLRARTV